MKYVFLINPVAGKGNLQDGIAENIKKYFEDKDEDYVIHITTGKGDTKKMAHEYAVSGERCVIFACGGEGTVFEALNGVVGYDNVSIGVIPCGSANDFLKFYDDKQKFFDIERQVCGEEIPVDLIKVGDTYCLNGCSVGMDAVVARDMSLFKNWPLVSGPLAYKLAIVKTFLSKIGIEAKITVDGNETYNQRCLFAVVANGPYYGGGYMAAPYAVPDDGKLDFTMVDVISKLRVPKFLKLYEKGEFQSLDYCRMKNCTSMEFVSEKPVPVNLDGEIIESSHLKFEIVKGGINFVIPKGVRVKNLIKN